MARIKQNTAASIANRTDELLKAPYSRVLIPEGDGYIAEVLEFPGCLAEGDSAGEALQNLEDAMRGWIIAALEEGQEIPEPSSNRGYSGKVALRLPRGLHRHAAMLAERDGTSLNQFLVAAIASSIGATDAVNKLAQRAFSIFGYTTTTIAVRLGLSASLETNLTFLAANTSQIPGQPLFGGRSILPAGGQIG